MSRQDFSRADRKRLAAGLAARCNRGRSHVAQRRVLHKAKRRGMRLIYGVKASQIIYDEVL